VYYSFRCDITGTGNKSVNQKSKLISKCIELIEVHIEASHLHFQYRYGTVSQKKRITDIFA